MRAAGTSIFTDPDDYQAGFRGAAIHLVLTCRGDFRARLTWVELPSLLLLRGDENLPRIACVSAGPARVCVAFPIGDDPPTLLGGVELQSGDIVFLNAGARIHQRTGGPSCWAFISFVPEHLRQGVKALGGLDVLSTPATRVIRLPAIAVAGLRHLHAKACHLAETTAKIAHPRVLCALEQKMTRMLADCLMVGVAHCGPVINTQHARIMNWFEELLDAKFDRQLRTSEICASVGVPERTLRQCSAEFLRMSPSRYMRLRRLNLVRAALRRADPAVATVAGTARGYGFSELGRFAGVYRSVFGESPSTTLLAPPVEPARCAVW